jgi:mRNA-degrading endonuclease RelE of RelBE toxin-antitoxin system
MDSFRIQWKRSAAKELGKLPKGVIARVVTVVEGLADDPFPPERESWPALSIATVFE